MRSEAWQTIVMSTALSYTNLLQWKLRRTSWSIVRSILEPVGRGQLTAVSELSDFFFLFTRDLLWIPFYVE